MAQGKSAQAVRDLFKAYPVIPALRTGRDVDRALKLGPRVVFLLGSSVLDFAGKIKALQGAGHVVFVHFDLIEGLRADGAALDYLLSEAAPEGVISTHKAVIDLAKKAGLIRILRIFVLDSEAVRKGRQLVTTVKPDFVELLPGVALAAVDERLLRDFSVPLIGGGLITELNQVHSILKKGVTAVSTSDTSLW
jgi:glycerol uptake operon antiterminator